MFKIAKPIFLICETPLHAGSGDSLGVVDLPIQRERHTGFPKIEASSLKGALRETFEFKYESREADEVFSMFGPEEDEATKNPRSGAMAFTDARLLFFPVKSVKGVFAYATCPLILEKFLKEMNLAKIQNIPKLPFENTITDSSKILINNDTIVLEEYSFKVKKDPTSSAFARWISELLFTSESMKFWKEKLITDLVVLSNDDFKDMVNLFTEVITRIKIDNNTGTVEKGALFTEEFLPQESILYSLVMASDEFKKGGKQANEMIEIFKKDLSPVFQLGGNATLGKGLLRSVLCQ
jgi:CRISPR-associated protein Cmr4